MKKIQDQGILFPILLTFGEKKGMRLFFYPAPKKLVFVDINKTTGMETASYALKLKHFDNRRLEEFILIFKFLILF